MRLYIYHTIHHHLPPLGPDGPYLLQAVQSIGRQHYSTARALLNHPLVLANSTGPDRASSRGNNMNGGAEGGSGNSGSGNSKSNIRGVNPLRKYLLETMQLTAE